MGIQVRGSLDPGKGCTKRAYYKDGKIVTGIFDTRGRLLKETESTDYPDAYVTEFGNEKWGLGASYEGKVNLYNNHTKNEGIHIAAIYTSLCEILNDLGYEESNNVNFVISVTNPLNDAKNSKKTQTLAETLKGKKEIVLNGKKYEFTIDKVAVRGEGTGACYYNGDVFKNCNALVVDLGDLNLNACAVVEGVVNQETHVTRTHGMQALHTDLKEVLQDGNHVSGTEISRKKLNDTLDKDVYVKGGEAVQESVSLIKEVKMTFVDQAISMLREKNHEVDTYDKVVFIGATSKVLSNQIKERIKHSVILENCQYANAIGNLIWMESVLG